MKKKRSSTPESDPFWLEQLESRVLLSAVPFDLPVEAHLPDDLPCPEPPNAVAVGPAAVAATAGIQQAAEHVPEFVTLPQATGPPDAADPSGRSEAEPGSDESHAPESNSVSPPNVGGRADDVGVPEDVVRGPASIHAARGLAIAAENVPEHVTLPAPIRPPADDASEGSDAPRDVIPGPASVRAASGLGNAAEHVPDHVTLPEPSRMLPRN